LSPGKKKIKIELEDAEGGKYNPSLEGNVSKDKILNACELMEFELRGQTTNTNTNNNTNNNTAPQART
jgi:hypothetical protein